MKNLADTRAYFVTLDNVEEHGEACDHLTTLK